MPWISNVSPSMMLARAVPAAAPAGPRDYPAPFASRTIAIRGRHPHQLNLAARIEFSVSFSYELTLRGGIIPDIDYIRRKSNECARRSTVGAERSGDSKGRDN